MNSIKFRLIILLIVMGLITVSTVWGSVYVNKQATNEYDEYVIGNREVNKIPILIERLATNLEILVRQKDEDLIMQINDINAEISGILDHLNQKIKEDEVSLMHYRMLENMHNYQREMIIILAEQGMIDAESYTELIYVKSLYSYMNNVSQQLIMAYLEYSSDVYADTLEALKHKQLNLNLMIVIVAFIGFLFSYVLFRNIFLTLKKLSYSARLLSLGKWHIEDIKQSNYTELANVANAFNKMKKHLIVYMAEVNQKARMEVKLQKQKLLLIEKDRLLKESQLLNLQMQMNPHFLFNTLNMIGRITMLKETKTAIKLIESISLMLRFNLESEGKLVPFSEELKSLNAYLYIQEVRFQDRISIHVSQRGDVSRFYIPPLILQPIVENSFIHGLEDCRDGGVIDIKINAHETYLTIELIDNGKGIDASKVNDILEGIHDKRKRKRPSIGIANVRKRLELAFAEEGLIQITAPQEPNGTSVLIRIPIGKEGMNS